MNIFKLCFILLLTLVAIGCQQQSGYLIQTDQTQSPSTSSQISYAPHEEKVPLTGATNETIQKEDIPEDDAPITQATVLKNPLSLDDLIQLAEDYRVQKGDTVSKIARRYHVGEGLISRLNNLENPNLIRIGQKLKVIQGPFNVIISKKDRVLDLYLKEQLIKSYDIAIGKNDSTPEGQFQVREKLIRPVWTDPYNRTLVYPGNPDYPLGSRWIEFAEHGYGIHGTNEPSSIKKEASFGCIRMLDTDVEELYDFLFLGSSIEIVSDSR